MLPGLGNPLRRRHLGAPGGLAVAALSLPAVLLFLGSVGAFGPAWRTPGTVAAFYVCGSGAVALLGLRACRARSFGPAVVAAAAAALLVRLSLAWVAPLDYDLQSYAIVVNAVNRGEVVYQVTDRYNYSPVWAHVLRATADLSRQAGLSPFFGFRLVTTAGDAGLALALLAFGLAGDTLRRAAARALLFWTNPVAIATSAFQGQFDALAIAFFVAALALVRRRGASKTLLAAGLVGAGIAVKQIVALFLAGFLGLARRHGARLRDAAVAAAPFVLLLLPAYLELPAAVARNVLAYSSLHGIWGWFYLVRIAGGSLPFPPAFVSYAALLLASGLAFLLVRRGDAGLDASRLAALVFLALTSGWGFQMLVWPLAFAPSRQERTPALLYTLAAMGAYADLIRVHDTNFVFMTLAWAAAVVWGIRLAPRLWSRPPSPRVV